MPSAMTLLSITDIADRFTLSAATVRTYNGQAAQRRRAGTDRPHDFPAPVSRVGNSPLFDADQIADWFSHRPGRGAGGGRPRKVREDQNRASATTSEEKS